MNLNPFKSKEAPPATAAEIFTKDKEGKELKKGDRINVHNVHPDDCTHLDAYSTDSKKKILNGTAKTITDIIISGGRGIVYIQEGPDKVHFYADSIFKV